MSLDEPNPARPTRADLEARIRVLEEKRDRLLEDLAAQRVDPGSGARISRQAAPGMILEMLEKALTTVQPSLAMMTEARDMVRNDRAEAERRSDTESMNEYTKALDELSAQVDEFTQTIARMNSAAETIRASLRKDANAASEPNETR